MKQSHQEKDYKNQKGLSFFNALKEKELRNKNSLIVALKSNQAEF